MTAQTQTINVDPMGIGLTYSNPGANFFDLVVTNPITWRGINIAFQAAPGATGTIEVWVRNGTHVGNEQLAAAPAPVGDPSGWELFGTNEFTSPGAYVAGGACIGSVGTVNFPNTELAPGTYGVALVFTGALEHLFDGVTTWPAPPGTFATVDVEITNGTTQAVAWTAAPLNAFNFGNPPVAYQGTIPTFSFDYDAGSVPHACAETETFGEGSIKVTGSFYDLLEDPVPTATALDGQQLEFINTGAGYVVGPPALPLATPIVAPATATALTPVDDGEEVIGPFSIPLPIVDNNGPSTVTELFVHSNGYISTGPQDPLFFTPITPTDILSLSQTIFALAYGDHNPTEVSMVPNGTGQILWWEDLAATPNPAVFVLWDNVEKYAVGVDNTSRFWAKFDQVTGNVTYVWENMDQIGGSTIAGGDDTCVGFSPNGPSPSVDEADITMISPTSPLLLNMPEVNGLTLDVVGEPLIGQTVDFVTSNVVGVSLGVTLISGQLHPLVPNTMGPPLPLVALGAPADTVAWLDASLSSLFTIDNANLTLPLPIANIPSLAGVEVYAQSFWFDLPSLLSGAIFNGLLSSNGVRIKLGNF